MRPGQAGVTCAATRAENPAGCESGEVDPAGLRAVASIAANPLFKDLAAATGNAPEWNFHKYVIDRSGHPVASFKSAVTPQDRDLTALIERLLKEAPAPARG